MTSFNNAKKKKEKREKMRLHMLLQCQTTKLKGDEINRPGQRKHNMCVRFAKNALIQHKSNFASILLHILTSKQYTHFVWTES